MRDEAIYRCAEGEIFLRRRRKNFKIAPKSQFFLRKNTCFWCAAKLYIAAGAPAGDFFQNRSKKSGFLKKKYMFLVRGEAIYSCRRAADDTFFAPQAKKIQNRSKNRVLKSTCFWRAAKLCIVVGAPQANFFFCAAGENF